MPDLSKAAAKAIAIAVFVLLIIGVLFLRQCSAERTADARGKLATEQGTAAIQSGQDAVQTIGNTQAREADIHATVQEGTDEIQAAPAGNSNTAAERATCRLRSYRNSSKCVALLGPAPR